MEGDPLDRGAFEQVALCGREAVETGSEQGLDRGRQRWFSVGLADFRLMGEQLLEEERIASADVGDAGAPGPRELFAAQAVDQRSGLRLRQSA